VVAAALATESEWGTDGVVRGLVYFWRRVVHGAPVPATNASQLVSYDAVVLTMYVSQYGSYTIVLTTRSF
jgi:hypothetical protein